VTNIFKARISQSKTSDEYIQNTLTYDTAKTRIGRDIGAFWNEIQKAKNGDETLNEKMISDLVNIHAQLTVTNDLLKKKIPEMYENCMKAQPGIRCPQP
jgi:hypothetical protein